MTVPYTANDDSLFRPTGPYSVAPVLYLPNLELSDDENAAISMLKVAITSNMWHLELLDNYYRGEARVADLGISIPPSLSGLKTVLGWPRVAVDSLEERIDLVGFRFPDSPDLDEGLQDLIAANDLESEQHLAHIDALVFGRSYVCVGQNDDPSQPPIVSIESPKDMAVLWNARTRTVEYALRLLTATELVLYTPNDTVTAANVNGQWQVVDRVQHGLGFAPVVQIANRARSYNRDGTSQITPELMSSTDRGVRTMQGLEVAREFYSAPQRYVLGADQSMFKDASGNTLSAWETYMGRVWAVPPDDDTGVLPQVGQFQAYDPATFTKVLEAEARNVATITGLPPHIFGFTTDNPSSADAIRSAENRLVKAAQRKCRSWASAWRSIAKLSLMVGGGPVPDDIYRLSPVWASQSTPTPAATTDAVMKMIQMEYLPPGSDVVGELLDLDPAQRARVARDRKTMPTYINVTERLQVLENGGVPGTVPPDLPGKPDPLLKP